MVLAFEEMNIGGIPGSSGVFLELITADWKKVFK